MKIKTLPTDYAIVLQQIYESGREDFMSLVETLRFDPKRLEHILEGLNHKGLIMRAGQPTDAIISLSGKGKRFIRALWPEASVMSVA